MEIICPVCGSCGCYSTDPAGKPNEQGHVECRCDFCGYYFVFVDMPVEAPRHICANPTCANCIFFDWVEGAGCQAESTGDNSGICSRLGCGVDGEEEGCSMFTFDPWHRGTGCEKTRCEETGCERTKCEEAKC